MPSTKRKKPTPAKSRKSKGQQLLISRFFTKAPEQTTKNDGTPAEANNDVEKEKPGAAETCDQLCPASLKQPQELETSSVITGATRANSADDPLKNQPQEETHHETSRQEKSQKSCTNEVTESKLVTPTRWAQSKQREEADTPATAVLDTPSSPRIQSSDSEDDAPRTLRKRRRLFLVDADDESDHEPSRRTTNAHKDPDFEVEPENEHFDDTASMMLIDEKEDNYRDDSNPPSPAKESAKASITLSSYGLQRGAEMTVLPRDEKQHRRFTQKIGRLEKNSFFLRRTGGGPQPEEVNAVEKGKQVKYTPLELQYVQLRKAHPDKLLVVECGYKYRMFDDDATTASKVLRVAAYFAHNFMTASFPTHRLAHHVRRLVASGHKVGVVSQSETAALKKASSKASKLFERKLSAVYTKGTIAADGKLVGDGSNGFKVSNSASYIMSIREIEPEDDEQGGQGSKIGIAAVDTAAGELFFDSFDNDALCSDLEARLFAMEPVEILMTRKRGCVMTEQVVKAYCDSSSCRLERLSASKFDPEAVGSGLRASVEQAKPNGEQSSELPLSCLGALMMYLKEFDLELSMTSASQFKSFRSSRQMKIGADVLRNFEVFGNSGDNGVEGSLLGLVNRTKTAFGSREMRQWLSHPLTNPQEINDRLDAVEYLRDRVDEPKRLADGASSPENALIRLLQSLGSLPDLERGLTRVSCRKCTPAEFVNVINAVEEVGRQIDHIKSFSHSSDFPALLSNVFSTTPNVAKTLDCGIAQVLNRRIALENRHHALFEQDDRSASVSDFLDDAEEGKDFLAVFDELKHANEALCADEKYMRQLLRKLKEQHSNPRWEWKKVAQEEYLLEVSASKSGSIPRSWTVISQTKAVKRYRPPEAEEGYDRVQRSRETRDAVSSRCWVAYLDMFSGITASLRVVVKTIIVLDCLAALARVSNLPGYAKPEIEMDDSKPAGLFALDARHPLTETLSACVSYVPNDIRLGRGEDEVAIVISGPNYGGKSSYARMTALIAMLGQIGSFVPARAARLSPFDSIHTRMGSTDSISKGMSSLMVELAETSRILSTATSRSLVVLDELGRGTSTHDGSAIAYSTLSHLVDSIRCSTIFVTHYPMLAALQSVYPGRIAACFMDYREDCPEISEVHGARADETKTRKSKSKSKITLLYKLTKGVASSSYGLNVARLAGIPSTVIDLAQKKATAFEESVERIKNETRFSELLNSKMWDDDELLRTFIRENQMPA